LRLRSLCDQAQTPQFPLRSCQTGKVCKGTYRFSFCVLVSFFSPPHLPISFPFFSSLSPPLPSLFCCESPRILLTSGLSPSDLAMCQASFFVARLTSGLRAVFSWLFFRVGSEVLGLFLKLFLEAFFNQVLFPPFFSHLSQPSFP